jgi:hypothetical protein
LSSAKVCPGGLFRRPDDTDDTWGKPYGRKVEEVHEGCSRRARSSPNTLPELKDFAVPAGTSHPAS